MKLTAIDKGANPADFLNDENISDAEVARRRELAIKAWKRAGSYRRMGEKLGCAHATAYRWVTGKRPVPARFISALQDVIGRNAA